MTCCFLLVFLQGGNSFFFFFDAKSFGFKSHKKTKNKTKHLSCGRALKEKVTLDLLAKVMRTSVSVSEEESMVYWGPAGSDFLLPADASRT